MPKAKPIMATMNKAGSTLNFLTQSPLFCFGFPNPIHASSSSAWVFHPSLFLTQMCCLFFLSTCYFPATFAGFLLISMDSAWVWRKWCWNMLSQACLSGSGSQGILPSRTLQSLDLVFLKPRRCCCYLPRWLSVLVTAGKAALTFASPGLPCWYV